MGLEIYHRDGFPHSSRVEESTVEYKTEQDTVSNFIVERCEDGCSDQDSDPTKVLHADYQKYCRANGVMREHMLGERDFGIRLDDLGHPSKKSGSRRFRMGLRLLLDDDAARAEEFRAEAISRLKTTYPTAPPPDASSQAGISYQG